MGCGGSKNNDQGRYSLAEKQISVHVGDQVKVHESGPILVFVFGEYVNNNILLFFVCVLCLSFSSRPDMTFTVDWALKANHLICSLLSQMLGFFLSQGPAVG